MPDDKDRRTTDDTVHDLIGEIASSAGNSSDNLAVGLIAAVVVGGALFGGYHATKFTVKQAKKQSKHVKKGAREIADQAKRVVDSADQVKSQAANLAKKVTRRGKKKDEPEQFPSL